MRFLLLALALVLGTGTLARADGPPRPTDLVDYDKGKDVQIAPGGTAHAVLKFKVKEGWHVNAHVPHEDFLVPTVLTLNEAGGVKPGKPVYPKPVEAKLSFSESPLAVYEDQFTVEVPLTVRWSIKHVVSGDRFRLYPHADIRVRDTLGAGYLNVLIRNTMTFSYINDREVF